eukprot:TRINITY_DN28705_c0_g1_i2.p1 TRINITY_DN28705_c0_g1~~TRINITY_DN28705_c0_g1_i2.p1  ORF type:complete len:204 (+),score=59.78 TRINITY_DN28705_c0_g1_i2:248-859(+)
MGQAESIPTLKPNSLLQPHDFQLSDGLLRRLSLRRRDDDYMSAKALRMELFEKTELPAIFEDWQARKAKEAYTFSKVPYQAGYGFMFGMCWRVPVDFYQGWKAANWRASGGVARVRRESHFSAGRFAQFLGLLYFYETFAYLATGKVGKEETTVASFFTAATLAAFAGWKHAVVQGATTAGFMYILISTTEYMSLRVAKTTAA